MEPLRARGRAIRGRGRFRERIFWQGEHDRPRPPRHCDPEGLADDFRDTVGAVDLRRPFGQPAEHADEIDLLERLAAEMGARHLSGQQDHRGRILKGGMNADAGVAGPGTARDQANPRPPGQLAMGLGHVGGAAFVAAGNHANRGRVVQRVKDWKVTFTRHAKRDVSAMKPQRIDQDAPAGARLWGERPILSHGGQ